jgi:hypothetical protein
MRQKEFCMQLKRSLITAVAMITLPVVTAWAANPTQIKYTCFEQGKESAGCLIPNQILTFKSGSPLKTLLAPTDNKICYTQPIPKRNYYASFEILPSKELPEGSKVKISLIHGPNVKVTQGSPTAVLSTGETATIQWESNLCQVLQVHLEPV